MMLKAANPLTTLDYRLASAELRISPGTVSVPKGIAGSVNAQVFTRDGGTNEVTDKLAVGAFVEATLRGPAFDARRIVGAVNAPLLLPPLNLVGDYRLDNIRLVDAATGATRIEGAPSSVAVHVFDEVLVSRVTSRPLTYAEIVERGIVIDDLNFRAVEFEVGFVLDGKIIPVKFPVVAPAFQQSTEIIPRAELEAMLVQAQAINQEIALSAELPPELRTAQLNLEVQGVNFQRVEDTDREDLTLSIPPIPALMVVPGNIGFLNQFFSVQIFTENAAPFGSGLSVHNVKAQLVLPPGPDTIASTNYATPGDDPLRFARVGPDKLTQPVISIVRPGSDGRIGTSDDIERLQPGESGQGEFLVEGLQEGLHVMNLDLTADLDGLATGTVKVMGKAAGSVLVRNPKFSMAFTHPRTVRSGEPYEASVTILNTSPTEANEVSVTLNGASLSGGVLETVETVRLGSLAPGQSATATWRVRPQRTGAVSFSNLTTGENGVQGRFRLRMGIDERGVVLSPDTLALPEFALRLPSRVLKAAERVLGQALSVATAPALPPGVRGVPRTIITRRVLELAEAGQRLAYGDPAGRVLPDLLLDWQGARSGDEGFDEIIRTTDAGREWREAMMGEMESGDDGRATARMRARAADWAGRGERWRVAGVSDSGVALSLETNGATAQLDRSGVALASGYRGARGHWLVANPAALPPAGEFHWHTTNAVAGADLAVLAVDSAGVARYFQWSLASLPSGASYRYAVGDLSGTLRVDADGDGVAEGTVTASGLDVPELRPEIVSVRQDLTVETGRPRKPCPVPELKNYGTVVAVLYSKPMRQEQVNVPTAYRLDNGVTAGSVQIQPGGRIALINLRQPIGAIRPRTLTVTGVTDPRGHTIQVTAQPVFSESRAGTALRGRVVRADGSPASTVPVTLTMFDEDGSGIDGCVGFIVRVGQVFTDDNGFYTFDFVPSGIPYSVSATDTSGLSAEAITALLESTVDDQLVRSKLAALIEAESSKDTLLSAFAASAAPQAIARAEGVERATLRDLIPVGSPREGTETPVALRFRGKGTVTGLVTLADGTTPSPGAAVNLYPDPGSRAQPRGVFADSQGRFAFLGVPLGLFTVQAQNSTGLDRTIAGELVENGETRDFKIVLAALPVVRTALQGRVLEFDGTTPHAGARVFIGRFDGGATLSQVNGVATADASGYWSVTNLPAAEYDVVAVSFDGKRKGDRRGISAVGGTVNFAVVILQGTSVVRGKVQLASGLPAANALVAGGLRLERTDANGLFVLDGVPTGTRTLSAGLERNTNAGIYATRFGSATLNVAPGADNTVVIRLNAAGRIAGRVYDATGLNPVPNVRVAVPISGGFQWVKADPRGFYAFENMPLRRYEVSAPAPAAAEINTGRLTQQIRSGTEADVEAAIGEAFALFTGAADPFLNGQGASFNPLTWGITTADLQFDGQTVNADIRYLRQGTVAGKVVNGQGVPIGARVRLVGVGPLPNGSVGTLVRAEANSDPALGTFVFSNAVLAGAWTLQASSPFFPSVIALNGLSLPPNRLDSLSNVLQFPPAQEVNGRLTGYVFNPDGSPAGSNVSVRISFGDLTVRTVGDGFYDTQLQIPQGAYSVTATNDDGLVGLSTVLVTPGVTNVCDVRLQGRGGLEVIVLRADGTPAALAAVQIEQGNFPYERASGRAGQDGQVPMLGNLSEGAYAICASGIVPGGIASVMGRSSAVVRRGEISTVTVRLAPTGTIRGRFVRRDGSPVDAAQVSVGGLGFSITDPNGAFEVFGVPLGTYRLVTQNPVNGIGAIAYVTVGFDGQTNQIQLIEQFRGEVRGYVVNSYRNGTVPGAAVTITSDDSLTPPRTVTSGPDGAYNIPGTPAARFTLEALDRSTSRRGFNAGTLAEGVTALAIDIPLEPLATLVGTVFQPDGVTRAVLASVELSGPGGIRRADTDTNGRVAFADLSLGRYVLRAQDRTVAQSYSAVQTNVLLSQVGPAPEFSVRLSGVGSVAGIVLASDGVTPLAGARVLLMMQTSLFYGSTYTTFSAPNGRFAFTNVPVGTYCLLANFGVLASSQTAVIRRSGQNDVVRIPLGSSGTVLGRLVRADGLTPVPDVDVLLTFASQSDVGGFALMRTSADGSFSLVNIPLGPFQLSAAAPELNGVVRLNNEIAFNLQRKELGDIRLDETNPQVVSADPPDGAGNVDVGRSPELLFSEPLSSDSVDRRSIYLSSYADGVIEATPVLVETNGGKRLLRIVPTRDLRGETTYDVVVLDQPYRGGKVLQDLAGRTLTASYVSRFTTRDDRRPQIASIAPTNNAVQIDPRAVLRVTFSEPVRRPTASMVTLIDGQGRTVPGTVALGLNDLVVTFTPTTLLAPNQRYRLTVAGGSSGMRDLSGNFLAATTNVLFDTLDTLGPVIQQLRIAAGKRPVAGAAVPFEALLANNEPGVQVRFTRDFIPSGLAVGSPWITDVTLSDAPSNTLRAIASDRYGNDGPVAELVVLPITNQPPTLTLTRQDPLSGPVRSSQSFAVRVGADDDYVVKSITLVSVGAFSFVTNLSGGATQTVNIPVPADLTAGAAFHVRAQAEDGLGAVSAPLELSLNIADGSAPVVIVDSPAADTLLLPETPLTLLVSSRDNSASHSLEITLSGALSASTVTNRVSTTNEVVQTRFLFQLTSARFDGTPLLVTVRGVDGSGNTQTATRTFRLPDRRSPQLIASVPANDSTRQSLWAAPEFTFSEPVSTNSASTNFLRLEGAGGDIPATARQETDPRMLVLLPSTLPLQPGASYTNVLRSGITDVAGNPLVQTNDTPWPANGVRLRFITAQILSASPASGAPIVPGQSLAVALNYEAGIGADTIQFSFSPEILTNVAVTAISSAVSAQLRLPADATAAELTVRLRRSGEPDYVRPAIALTVRSRTADDDGDGWLNGFEADRQMNPFVADADGADFDGDGLTNGQERAAGTDPGRPDTDGDTVLDGIEVAQGSSPILADTDGDGLRDDLDPSPAKADTAPALVATPTVVTVLQGRSTNAIVSGTDADGNLRSFIVTPPLGVVSARWNVAGREEDAVLDAYAAKRLVDPARVLNPADDRFAAWWKADGDAVDSVRDHHGEPRNGATFAPGKIGQAFQLDGGNDYIDLGTATDLNFRNVSFTVSTWIYLTRPMADDVVEGIVSRYSGGQGGSWILGRERGAGGVLWFALDQNGAWYPDRYVVANTRDITNQWHHVAGVYDHVTGTISLYLDGRLDATSLGAPLSLAATPNSPVSIGAYYSYDGGNGAPSVPGLVDEVALFNRALTAAEVQALYAYGEGAIRQEGRVAPETLSLASLPILSPGSSGQFYSNRLEVAFGVPPYTFEVLSGAPPAGITLRSDGTLVGVPTTNGFGAFSVRVRDALGRTGQDLFGLRIGASPAASTNALVLNLATNTPSFTASLLIHGLRPGTSTVQVVVRDATLLQSTNWLTVVTVPDLDGDGLPDASDPDADGDGWNIAEEIAAGTDPAQGDTDGDSIADARDPLPLQANRPPEVLADYQRSGSLQFDGSLDYVEVPAAPSLDLHLEATLSCWVSFDQLPSKAGHAMALLTQTRGALGDLDLVVGNSDNVFRFVVGSTLISPVVVETGRWYHVAATYRAAEAIQLFIDGNLVARETIGYARGAGAAPIGMGNSPSSRTQPFAGRIDDVQIWNVARTGDQIRSDSTRRLTGLEPGLVAYYTFSAPSTAVILDQSIYRNHGQAGAGNPDAQPRWQVEGNPAIRSFNFTNATTALTAISLRGTDPDGDPLQAVILSLPQHGRLFQTSDGTTLGTAIDRVPTRVQSTNLTVLFRRASGYTGDDRFTFQLSDAGTQSFPGLVSLELFTPPGLDTDGDGIPDVAEAQLGLDADAPTAGVADTDGDGLTDLREFQLGLRLDRADTDNDLMPDGAEVAAQTDPLSRDTDGDGLVDGEDPQPLLIEPGLALESEAAVVLYVGESTNLVIRLDSDRSPISLVDFWPTNLPPPFATLGPLALTNSATNGILRGTLSLNPIHDAAGVHLISLRAATKDGRSGIWNIHVTVLPEPSLQATHWRDPVSGNWSDPTKWSQGVPNAERFAVIDATGNNYVVTLDQDPVCRGLIVDSPNATLATIPAATFVTMTVDAPIEIRQGALEVSGFMRLHLNRPVFNAGRIRNVAASVETTGSGWIDNAGNVQATGGRAVFRLPLFSRPGSRIVAAPGSTWFMLDSVTGTRAPLICAGTIEAGYPGLNLEAGLTLLSGANLTGDGQIAVQRSTRGRIEGDVPCAVNLFSAEDSIVYDGPGTLYLQASRWLNNVFFCPVVLQTGCSTLPSPAGTFNAPLTIQAGATLKVQGRPSGGFSSITLNAPTTNYGVIAVATGDIIGGGGGLSGAGLVENFGQLLAYSTDQSGPATGLGIVFHHQHGSEWTLSENARLLVQRETTLAGRLTIAAGARLATTPPASFVVKPGGEILGAGELRLEEMLILEADLALSARLTVLREAVGDGLLTLIGPQTLSGRFRCPVAVGIGNSIPLPGLAEFWNSLHVPVGSQLILEPGADLRLHPQARLINEGTVTLKGCQGCAMTQIEPWLVQISDGIGTMTNSGLVEAITASGGTGSARISVPLNVLPKGRLRVGDGMTLEMYQPGNPDSGLASLRAAGSIELGRGSVLTASSLPIEFNAGAEVYGDGKLVLSSRNAMLQLSGPATVSVPIEVVNGSAVVAAGPGTLRLEGAQTLLDGGQIHCPIVIASNAVVTVRSDRLALGQARTSLHGPVKIERGGLFQVLGDVAPFHGESIVRQLGIYDLLRNEGTLVLGSGFDRDHYRVEGTGRIENAGLIRVIQEAPGSGRALVCVPIDSQLAGRVEIEPAATLAFSCTGGGLSLDGRLNIAAGARLQHLGANQLSVRQGAVFAGPGQIAFLGDSRLNLEADATIGGALLLSERSATSGDGRLILSGQQRLSGVYHTPVVLRADARAEVDAGTAFHRQLWLDAGAILRLTNSSPNLVAHGVIHNEGEIEIESRSASTADRIVGTGRMENSGLIHIVAANANTNFNAEHEAVIGVPVTILPGGEWRQDSSAYAALTSPGLTNAGTLFLAADSLLTFRDNSTLTVQPGATLTGDGVARFVDLARLQADGDASVPWRLQFSPTSVAAGPGTLTWENDQGLAGTFACPTVIGDNVLVEVLNAAFSNSVQVSESGTLHVPPGRLIRLDAVLTNYGQVTMASGDLGSTMTTLGPGCVVNVGVIRVDSIGSGTAPASLCVPIIVQPEGVLALGPNARLDMCDGAFLSVAGIVETGAGSVLRFRDSPTRNLLTLYAGATLRGSGSVTLEGQHRLLVLGRATVTGGVLELSGASEAGGNGRLIIDPQGRVRVDHSLTMAGTVDVRGTLETLGSGTTVGVNGTLLLSSSGALLNAGTVRVGAFDRRGGTIVGSLPVVIGPTPPRAWITLVDLHWQNAGLNSRASFRWTSAPGDRFHVLVSRDLSRWETAIATIEELLPGLFEATLPKESQGSHFFRVQLIDNGSP